MTNKELLRAKEAELKKIKTALDECNAVIKVLKASDKPAVKPAAKTASKKAAPKSKTVKK